MTTTTRRTPLLKARASLLAVGLCCAVSTMISAAELREARESTVSECEFLGKVEGTSGYGKRMGSWEPVAKAQAMKRAAKLGATDVVWQQMVDVGVFNGRAIARAYRCTVGQG
ncbi:MAG: hypothetical protein U1E83_11750 [Methylotetracoccus sp.]